MALVPEVQEEKPEQFLNYSKVASQPMHNEAGETRGKGQGQFLTELGRGGAEIAQGANSLEQSYIANEMQQQWDTLAQNRIAELQRVDNLLTGDKGTSTDAPPNSQRLAGKVDNLIAVRDNGRVSDTHFEMQKNELAKSWRQFPFAGQRAFVDSEFSRLTNHDPANAVIRSLTADINAHAQAGQQWQHKIEGVLIDGLKNGWVTPDQIQAVHEGKADWRTFANEIYKRQAQRSEWEDTKSSASAAIEANRYNQMKAEQDFRTQAATEATMAARQQTIGLGNNPMQTMSDYMQQERAGTAEKPSGEQAIAIAQKLKMDEDAYNAEVWKKAAEPIDPSKPNSPTYMSLLGPQAIQEIANQNGQLLARNREHFYKGDVAAAAYDKAVHDVRLEQGGKMLTETLPLYSISAAMAHDGGQQAGFFNMFFDQFGMDKTLHDQMQTGWKALSGGAIITQPPKMGGGRYSVSGVLETGKQFGLFTGNGNGGPAWDIVKGTTGYVTDPNASARARENAGLAISDPSNAGLIDMFQKDGWDVDPTTGQFREIPGKTAVYEKMYSPEVTDGMIKIGNPTMISDYVRGARNNFAAVAVEPLKTLAQHADDPSVKFGWTKNDDGSLQVEVFTKRPQGFEFGFRPSMERTQNELYQARDLLNRAMKNISYIDAKITHEDTQAFIASRVINEMPSFALRSKMKSAMQAANKPPPKATETATGEVTP